MKRSEVNKIINHKIDELHRKYGSGSRKEMMRELLVAGIRSFTGNEDFLRPYPAPERKLINQGDYIPEDHKFNCGNCSASRENRELHNG